MAPPIVTATLQSSLLAAISNLLAQALTAYRTDDKLVIDWIPVFQFVLYAMLSTPPNFLWQDFLESTFPAMRKAAPALKDKKDGKQVEAVPKLDLRNTITKLVLDQTVGAAVNTIMFSMFIHSISMAMAHRPVGAEQSMMFLMGSLAGISKDGKPALDFTAVRLDEVVPKVKADFLPLMTAGLRLWPLVSLVNFAFVETVQMRNLLGSLAGVGWGVYVSLFAAGN